MFDNKFPEEALQKSPMASLSKFKGSLVGAVLGDCIGAIYECSGVVKVKELLETIHQIERDYKANKKCDKKKLLQFTDDTAMARSVASSLIANKGLNIKDMAQRFTDEYFREPWRGYGGSVGAVFTTLQNDKVEDVFEPARRQFEGQGSYGNGGAMRIVPAALFCLKDSFNQLKETTISISRVTHSHIQAVQGAVLQSSAVDLALREDASKDLDRNKFLDDLIARMKPMEEELQKETNQNDEASSPSPKKKTKEEDIVSLPYCHKLEKMKEFLRDRVPGEKAVELLGNNISAFGSAPTAVYAFLRSQEPVEEIPTDNPFERTVLFAISLGGDTDTIATMAAAISGAYHGYEIIPGAWQAYCEGVQDAKGFAQDLWELQDSPEET